MKRPLRGTAIEAVVGRDFLALEHSAQEELLAIAAKWWRNRGFPYPKLTRREIEREFYLLSRIVPEDILDGDCARVIVTGLRLANAFHPQMWSIRQHGRSPRDCFHDDARLVRTLRKAAHFWPDRRCWNDQCLRSTLRVLHRFRVANFRPTLARVLCATYSQPGATVLDFAAGFGGRLLGASTLRRHYIGIDPAAAQIRGLRRLAKRISPWSSASFELHRACAEDWLPEMGASSVDIVLSSPPYYNRERYSRESTQSYLRYPSYQEWSTRFLAVVLDQCHRILRPKGYLLLNVADSAAHPVARDALLMLSRRFAIRRVIRQLMPTSPTQRAINAPVLYRWEPVFVCQKSA